MVPKPRLYSGAMKTLIHLSLALLAASPSFAGKDPVYALTGARIVPVSGPVLENATLLLRDGLISDVGTAVKVPADARVIDAKGLTLTPGLVDGFGRVGLPSPPPRQPGQPAAPAAGPGPLAPQAMVYERLRPADAAKAREAGITTALVVPEDGVLPGQSVLINTAGDKPESMVVMQPMAQHLHMATVGGGRYPGSLMGTVAYVRQALLDAAHYRDEWAAYERAPKGRKRPAYDPSLEAWRRVLDGDDPLIVTARRENDLRRALALRDEFKIPVIVAGAMQAARLSALVKSSKLPLLVSVNYDPPAAAVAFGNADTERDRQEIAAAEGNPAALHKAGVAFALVSGHGRDFLAGVRKAIDKGLPRDVALRAITLAPAEVLGVADRLGSIEAGKIGNVVAWSGEPLTKEAKAKYVFVDGRLYEPDGADGPKAADKTAEDPKPADPAAAAAKPAAAEWTPAVPPHAPVVTAITGATLLTVSSAGRIENGTIVIKDGRIAAVGKDVKVPAGATVIDAAGRFVTPGLIDAHSHTGVEGSVNECTDSITAQVRITDVIDDRDVDIFRQLAGGVTAVNVLHGSCNAIGGQNATLKMRWGRSPEELLFKAAPPGIKFALGENPKRANFRVPGRPPRYPGTRMGVEVVIREGFARARAYKQEWDEYEKKLKAAAGKDRPLAPRKDLQLEELKAILEGKVFVHAHCYRADEILMLIRVADEFGFKIRTFQHVLEGYKVASEIARHGAGGSTFSDWWAYKMEAFDAIPYNAAIMAAHGVNVSLNSDSNELARRLYWEAAKAVKYGGVSEDEALKMITINPAWQLGVEQRAGSIEVGKDADLAIFSAHPFAPDAIVEKTLVDGALYFDRARDLATRGKAAAGGAR
jgi:imidazolonepropionase-like amidohydrolase